MAKKPTKLSLLDALGAIQRFIVGAGDAPQLTAATIREQLDAIDLVAAEAEVERLSDKRSRILVEGTDAEIEAVEAEIAAATRAADRARAYMTRLEAMLATAEDREAEATLARKRADAEQLTADAIAAIQRKLPEAYRVILDVLRLVGKAEAAVANVNDYTDPSQHLVGPEGWRNEPSRAPERIISSKQVRLWALPETGQPLDERYAVQVRDTGGGQGTLTVSYAPGMPSRTTVVERRTFNRIERQPERYGDHIMPLAASLLLPPLRARETEYWDGSRGRRVEGTELLALLDETAAQAGQPWPEPAPVVTFEPVPASVEVEVGVGEAMKGLVAKIAKAA